MIPIDEQIKHQQNTVKIIEDFDDQESLPKEQAILASLQRLKAIDAVQMPDEPDWLKYYRTEVECGNLKDYKQFINHIDTLCDMLRREKEISRIWRDLASEREAINAAMLKLGENPSEEIRNCISTINTTTENFKAMFAKLIEQAGVKK